MDTMTSSQTRRDFSQQNASLEPCCIVIFGATGDLTARRLMPALYNLAREKQLPQHFACVAFARREKDHDLFREEMERAINEHSRNKPVQKELWEWFRDHIFYHRSEFDNDAGYYELSHRLAELDYTHGTAGNRIFYLSTQPSYFPLIIEKLSHHKLLYEADEPRSWSRVILEKPFGHDLETARALQSHLCKYLDESQLYRIDHWLGKETVQNLLAFRFANAIFEPLWNRHHIDHVEITVAEDIGIGSRGRFFEEMGILRDIVQNHVMQLLCLIAMEAPVSLDAKAIRDEKVKVLEAIRPLSEEEIHHHAFRGQYDHGTVHGTAVAGYRDEENVAKNSNVETYAALRLFIDNWRWSGVPFYLRAGKRLPKRSTEIVVQFKAPPYALFRKELSQLPSNTLRMRIQPNEGIALTINCKEPGPHNPIFPVNMDFRYESYFGLSAPEAYERLLCDCIQGDGTLFAREDEVMAAWRLLTPVLDYWASKPAPFPNYKAGTWGPEAANAFFT